MNRNATLALIAFAAAAVAPSRAAAITGTLTPAYGTELVVQTTQTTADAASGTTVELANGYELDAGYGYIADGALHLFFTGNLAKFIQLEGFIPRWLPMDIFLDTRSGGQNQLLPNNPIIETFDADMTKMTGLTFDPGFEADWWFCLEGDLSSITKLKAYQAELPTAGGGAGAKLGVGTCGGPGTLSGGTNPFGVEATLDDRNMAGVTQGCGAASGAGVTTGIEWSIPLAAIGNPTECIRVCAFAANGDHSQLFNQVLGPLPPGTCNLGASSAVNFGGIAGDQFFSVCPAATPTRHSTWGALKSIYR
jgi:hypothetical protein